MKTERMPARMYVSRAERFEKTGVAVSTQIEMESRGVGPEPLRPHGFGKVMYRLEDVIKWMEGESLPSWTPALNSVKKNRRGDNLLRPGHPRPGRPKKKPSKHKAHGGTGEVS